ncbi:transcriptional regulator [Streptomyces mashuensis]|uniref:Transcriptional regulator n=1 Tax=Streptomyces mashuensis TaxID=33904 RepID=A0A919EC83_9ACTN|nr:helix-turn-helix transcriptional regulator [Streptomyces mashuensis]GHF38877.1 transcriptional regulator [Streptomyces mashuensis]
MAARRGPTGHKIELGIRLRQLRDNADLTMKQAVEGLGFSDAKLQRVEKGELAFRHVGELRALLERYGLTDRELVDSLVELNKASNSRSWVTQVRQKMPPGMTKFVGAESEAREIRAFHPTVVHGLLQTENYAQGIFERSKPIEETTTQFIRDSVAIRMQRQEPVLREDDPLKLWVVLCEVSLQYVMGDDDVMIEQYRHIATLSQREHIRVQVLPTAHRGYRSSNDFAILDLGEGLPSMVQTDTAGGAVSTSDTPEVVERFGRKFEAMAASALPPEETTDFMYRLERELQSH